MNKLKLKFVLFCYNIVLIVIFIIYLLWLTVSNRKKIQKLFNKNLTNTTNNDKSYIWLHASSIGESKQIFGLVSDLLIKYKDTYNILITTCTESSRELWIQKFGNKITYKSLPWDIKFITKNFINNFPIKIAIFIEADFWPNLLFTLKEHKIPTLLFNGRISDKSYKAWLNFKSIFTEILRVFSFIGTDSQRSCKYFEDFIGKGRVAFFGNLKYIQKYETSKNNDFYLKFSSRIKDRENLMALSTHDPEEIMLGKLHLQLKKVYPNLLTILAPRHVERSLTINILLKNSGLNTQLLSDNSVINESTDIYIVDIFGESTNFIEFANIVYIGKSMYKSCQGGHNLLEPMAFGKPVIFGPYMSNFKEIYEDAIKNKAAIMVNNREELYNSLKDILNNNTLLKNMGCNAKFLISKAIDTKNQYVKILEHYIGV